MPYNTSRILKPMRESASKFENQTKYVKSPVLVGRIPQDGDEKK